MSLQEDGRASALLDPVTQAFYAHSSANRISTDTVLVRNIRQRNRGLHVTIVPAQSADLLGYAAGSGKAAYRAIVDEADPLSEPLTWQSYIPPTSRLGGSDGLILAQIKFGKYAYEHEQRDYIIYVSEARDGASAFPSLMQQYIVHSTDLESAAAVNKLILDAGKWSDTLHDQIWVFDQGYWQKESDLFQSIRRSRWQDVILEQSEKDSLRQDVKRFFASQDRYNRYRIAWKRGVIYYGPPGNGKTISIKALSNELYSREQPIPTLYVKSLSSFAGPEYSVKQIFAKARAQAPCLLVFEDLDSLVTDSVRSYFLNEIDGLNANEGVYMIGSTNHIERLDPGISKRPSRFDRKFEFSKPDEDQRTTYCEYWRQKLKKSEKESAAEKDQEDEDEEDLVHIDADDLDFPKELCPEIAKITDGFSFAYLQEAFVATLLIIVSAHDDEDEGDGNGKTSMMKDKFDDILFWRVIKKQVALLKEQI